MPLVQGREVKIKPGQPESIQKKINTIDDLPADLKSEIDPIKYTRDDYFGQELSSNEAGFSLFEKDSEQNVHRKTRYEYFREMDTNEFIHRGLEIVADDSTQDNPEGNALKIFSGDEQIKERLEGIFYDKLDLNNEIWSVVFETAKMGDNFYEVVVDNYKKPKEVIALVYREPDKMERIEVNGKLSHFVFRTNAIEDENRISMKFNTPNQQEEQIYKLQPWQVIHFKLENKGFSPYGASLLYPGLKTYRRLNLLEDVMLVYRLSRAPERRVFYIDVGSLNRLEAKRFLEKVKNQYRTSSFIDEDGKINKKARMLSITSDIFVPVREGGQGTKIETLQGGEALHNIDDMKYFRDKILRTMNIPPAYMGDEADRSRGTLCLHPDTRIKLSDGRDISIKQITEEYNQGKINYVYSVNEETHEWEINKILKAEQTRKNAELVEVFLDNGESIKCTPDHKFMLRNGTYKEAQYLKENDSLMPIYAKTSSINDRDKLNNYEMILNNKTEQWEYTHQISLNEKENGYVIHHKDFNKKNNNPDNLVLMEKQEHLDYHREVLLNNLTPEMIEKRNKSIRKFYSTEEGLKIIRSNQKKAASHPNRLEWLHSEEHKELKRKQMAIQRERGDFNNREIANKKISGKNNYGYRHDITIEKIKKIIKENNIITLSEFICISGYAQSTVYRRLKTAGYCGFTDIISQPVNHKIISVEFIGEKVDTYDITVENTPNFAISAGIVIHNSQLDIKFSRFIERIQHQVIKGLNKVAALELFFAGFKKDKLNDFNIELTAPSNIKEITEIDMMNQRMGLLGTIQALNIFSDTWMLKNILKLSDAEIADIKLYKTIENQERPPEEGEIPSADGAAAVPGAEVLPGETGIPPEGGAAAVPRTETTPGETPIAPPPETPEEIAANTMVHVLGQDFILENQEDFFGIIKFINENKKEKDKPIILSELIEDISELFESSKKKNRPRANTNNVVKQLLTNELGGLVFENGKEKKKKMKLWEGYMGTTKGKKIQKFRTKTIVLS